MLWLVFVLGYAVVIAVFFAVKLNRNDVVQSAVPANGEIERIDFYWRPG